MGRFFDTIIDVNCSTMHSLKMPEEHRLSPLSSDAITSTLFDWCMENVSNMSKRNTTNLAWLDLTLREEKQILVLVFMLFQASIMHYGSISLITEPSRSTHMEAMRVARDGGSLLSYDPNLRLPLWPSADAARDAIKSIWDQADIIKVRSIHISLLLSFS